MQGRDRIFALHGGLALPIGLDHEEERAAVESGPLEPPLFAPTKTLTPT